jgi:pimeloyl-ACP methyl ester carboxylesterase
MRSVLLAIGLVIVVVLAGAAAALLRFDLPVDQLERQYSGPTSRFLDHDGMRVHYRDEGSGPVLVLLHGTAASLHTWDGWTNELRDDFRMIRLDLPGFGLTGPHPEHDYRVSTYVRFLAGFLARLEVDRFALAGNSLGGNLAWNFALEHPEHVERLILVDPSGASAGGGPPPLIFRLAQTPGVGHLMARMTPRGFIERNLREVYGDPARITPELVDRYHDLLRRPGNRDAFIARARSREPSRFGELHHVAVPTLLLWGEQDRWIPVEQAQRFLEALPDARLIVYPGAGHLPMEEIPQQTARDVRAFLTP